MAGMKSRRVPTDFRVSQGVFRAFEQVSGKECAVFQYTTNTPSEWEHRYNSMLFN